MKKIVFMGIAALALASCKKEVTTEVTTDGTDTIVKEEVIVTPPSDTIQDDGDGTSVNVSSDGIDVKSKDGKNKTDVEIKDGGAAVEVKK